MTNGVLFLPGRGEGGNYSLRECVSREGAKGSKGARVSHSVHFEWLTRGVIIMFPLFGSPVQRLFCLTGKKEGGNYSLRECVSREAAKGSKGADVVAAAWSLTNGVFVFNREELKAVSYSLRECVSRKAAKGSKGADVVAAAVWSLTNGIFIFNREERKAVSYSLRECVSREAAQEAKTRVYSRKVRKGAKPQGFYFHR